MTEDQDLTPFKGEDEEEGQPLSVEEQEVLQEIGVAVQPQTAPHQPSQDYEQLFNDIFLEIYDVEYALNRSTEKYTEVLLKRGIEVNATAVYQHVDMITTRLMKINTIKRLCNAFGLHGELDTILEKELSLMYSPTRPTEKPRRVDRTIVGEHHE